MAETKDTIHQGNEATLAVTQNIVAAYVTNNSLPQTELEGLIRTVHAALKRLNGEAAGTVKTMQPPAVSIKKSVTPDYLICLEDGAKLKTLRRYLQRFDLTPEQYRTKWGLPHDYPMVAPSYSARRSQLAKASGLGRKPKARKRRKRG